MMTVMLSLLGAAAQPVRRLALDPLDGAVANVAVDVVSSTERYLLYGTSGLVASVVKVALSNHSRVGALLFNSDDGSLLRLAVDSPQRQVFCSMSSGRLVRVWLDSLSRGDEIIVAESSIGGAAAEVFAYTGAATAIALSSGGNQLFAASENPGRGILVRRLDTARGAFGVTAVLPVLDVAGASSLVFVPAAAAGPRSSAGRLYIGAVKASGPHMIVALAVNATGGLAPHSSFPMEQGDSLPNLLYDARSASLVVLLRNSPARVARYRLSDYARTGLLKYLVSQHYPYAGVIDPVSQRLFVVMLSSPFVLGAVSLDSFEDLGQMTVMTAPEALEFGLALAIDPVSGLLYCGLGTTPGTVLVLDTSDRGSGQSAGNGTFVAGGLRQLPLYPGRPPPVLVLDDGSGVGNGTTSPAVTVVAASSLHDTWQLRSATLEVAATLIAPIVRSEGRTAARSELINGANDLFSAAAAHPAEGCLYLVTASAQGKPTQVLRMRPSGMLLERRLMLPSGYFGASALLLFNGVVADAPQVLVGVTYKPSPSTPASAAAVVLRTDTFDTAAELALNAPCPACCPACSRSMLSGILSPATGSALFLIGTLGLGGIGASIASLPLPVNSSTPLPVITFTALADAPAPLQPAMLISHGALRAQAWLAHSVNATAAASMGAAGAAAGDSLTLLQLSGNGSVSVVGGAQVAVLPASAGRVLGGWPSASRNNALLVVTQHAMALVGLNGLVLANAALPVPRSCGVTSAAWDEAGSTLFLGTCSAENDGTVARLVLAAGGLTVVGDLQSRDLGAAATAMAPAGAIFWKGTLYVAGGRVSTSLQTVRASDFSLGPVISLPMRDAAATVVLNARRGSAIVSSYRTAQLVEIDLATLNIIQTVSAAFASARSAVFVDADNMHVMVGPFGLVSRTNFTLRSSAPSVVASPPYSNSSIVYWQHAVADVSTRPYVYIGAAVPLIARFNWRTAAFEGPPLSGFAAGTIASGIADRRGDYVYFGTRSEPGAIITVDLINWRIAGVATGRALLDNFIQMLPHPVLNAALVAFGTETSPAGIAIVPLPPTTLDLQTPSVQLVNANVLSVAALDTAKHIAYFASFIFPQQVVRFNASVSSASAAQTPRVQLLAVSPGQGEGYLRAATWYPASQAALLSPLLPAGDTHFALFGTALTPGRILRVGVPSLTRLDTLVMPADEDYFSAAAVDTAAGIAYFCTDRWSGGVSNAAERVIKVSTAGGTGPASTPGLVRLGGLNLPASARGVTFAIVDPVSGSLLVGAGVAPGMIIRIDLATFTVAGSITLPAALSGLPPGSDIAVTSASLDAGRGALYVGLASSPGRVVRVDVTVPALTLNPLPLELDGDSVRSVTSDSLGSTLFVGVGGFNGGLALALLFGGRGFWPGAPDFPYFPGFPFGMVLNAVPLDSSTSGTPLRALAEDTGAGFLYGVTDGDPPQIVQFVRSFDLRLPGTVSAVHRFPARTQRPASLLLVPPASLAPGNVATLLMSTDSVTGFVYAVEATPAIPRIDSVTTANVDALQPPALVRRGLPVKLQSSCLYADSRLLFVGSFWGNFLPDFAGTFVRGGGRYFVEAIYRYRRSGIITRFDVNPTDDICSPFECTDGHTCACSFNSSQLTAAAVNLSTLDAAAAAVDPPLLDIAQVSFVFQRTQANASTPFAAALVMGAPQVLRVSPSVIAAHDTLLTVDLALRTPFRPALGDAIVLTAGVPDQPGMLPPIALRCTPISVDASGQTVTCAPPALERALLGINFDVTLVRLFMPVASLPGGVRYAWPVFASLVAPFGGLDPQGATAAAGSQTLTLLSPALVPDPSNCTGVQHPVRVWVGSSLCASPRFTDSCGGILTCTIPAGIGRNVPVIADVGPVNTSVGAPTAPGTTGDFSVVSVEAIADSLSNSSASVYDGAWSTLPVPPRQGFVTTVSYATPSFTSLVPAEVALYAFGAGSTDGPARYASQAVLVRVAGSRLPPATGASLVFSSSGLSASGSLTCLPTAGISSGSEVACFLPSAGIEAALATRNGGRVAGSATMQLRAQFLMPGWPPSTGYSLNAPAGVSFVAHGLPLVLGVSPVAGVAGTTITISGQALGPPAFADSTAVNVMIGAAVCLNLTVIDDKHLRCVIPPFAQATGGSSSVADVAVVVHTPVGSSLTAEVEADASVLAAAWAARAASSGISSDTPLASFRYASEMNMRWALSDSAAAAVGMVPAQLHSAAPLSPVPAVELLIGRFSTCELLLSSWTPLGSASLRLRPESASVLAALPAAVSSGQGEGIIVAFPGAALVAPSLTPTTAWLAVRCTDTASGASVTTAPRPWSILAPRVRWSDVTLAALAARSAGTAEAPAFFPTDADTPPLALVVSLARDDGSGMQAELRPGEAPADVFAAVMAGLSCTGSLTQMNPPVAPPATDGRLSGSVAVVNTSAADAAAAGSYILQLPALSLRAATVGSTLSVLADCTWAPLSTVLPAVSGNASSAAIRTALARSALTSNADVISTTSLATVPLQLRIVSAAVEWELPPPLLIESQVYIAPAPRVRLRLMGLNASLPTAAESALFACELDAAKGSEPQAAVNSSLSISSPASFSTGSSSGSAVAADTIVIKQAAAGNWSAPLRFNAFSISGRRRVRYDVTAVCTLGGRPLPALHAPTSIAGCPAGQAPSGLTGWLCVDCVSGSFSLGGDAACQPCPSVGASCATGSLVLQPGFYRPPAHAGQAISASSEMHPCPNPDACLVNASYSPEQTHTCDAASGYGGTLCGVCQSGFSASGVLCSKCWPSGANMAIILALVLLLLGGAAWLAIWSRPGARSPAAIAFRQLVGFLQTVSVISAFRLQAASLVRGLLGWTDATNASILSFGPVGCELRASFFARYLITLLLPLLAGILVAAIAGTHACWRRRRDAAKAAVQTVVRRASAALMPGTSSTSSSKSSSSSSAGTGRGSIVSSEPPAAGMHARSDSRRSGAAASLREPPMSLRNRLLSSVVTLASLLYMPLISASLRALDCYERPVDGVVYLRADLSVVCGQGSHVVASALAWAVLVLLGLGYPGAIVLCLMRVRQQKPLTTRPSQMLLDSSGQPVQQPRSELHPVLRPLYDGYSRARGVMWWEAVILLRRGLLALTGAFLSSTVRGVAVFAFIILASHVLHTAVHPFDEPRLNTAEGLSLAATLAIALLALMYSPVEVPGAPGNSGVTAAILLILIFVLLFLVVQVLRSSSASADAKFARCSALARRAGCARCFPERPVGSAAAAAREPEFSLPVTRTLSAALARGSGLSAAGAMFAGSADGGKPAAAVHARRTSGAAGSGASSQVEPQPRLATVESKHQVRHSFAAVGALSNDTAAAGLSNGLGSSDGEVNGAVKPVEGFWTTANPLLGGGGTGGTGTGVVSDGSGRALQPQLMSPQSDGSSGSNSGGFVSNGAGGRSTAASVTARVTRASGLAVRFGAGATQQRGKGAGSSAAGTASAGGARHAKRVEAALLPVSSGAEPAPSLSLSESSVTARGIGTDGVPVPPSRRSSSAAAAALPPTFPAAAQQRPSASAVQFALAAQREATASDPLATPADAAASSAASAARRASMLAAAAPAMSTAAISALRRGSAVAAGASRQQPPLAARPEARPSLVDASSRHPSPSRGLQPSSSHLREPFDGWESPAAP